MSHGRDPQQAAWLTLLEGDARTVLATLPAESVNCVVTSPPYWGLRDFGMAGQMGLEETPDEYLDKMVELFREVRRVLRADGTVWLNMGDSYVSGQGGRQAAVGELPTSARSKRPAPRERHDVDVMGWGERAVAPRWFPSRETGWKPKDLVGMPWLLALALRSDGWYLRADIIWSKPNPMPESCTDRPTKAHEYVFLLTRSARYFYDADAIREPLKPKTFTTFGIPHQAQGNDALGGVKSDNWGRTVTKRRPKMKKPDGWNTAPGAHGSFHPNGREKGAYQEAELAGANKRSVWEIAIEPYPQAHFATFPIALVKPCILAGCPEGGVVLDPFLGSGTTAYVANQLGRRAIGIDLNPAYLELARERCKQVAIWEVMT